MADEQPKQGVNPPAIQVSWSLPEYLDRLGTRLDEGFSRVETKLESKADKADLAGINARLDEHGKAIDRIKEQIRSNDAISDAIENQRTSTAERRQKRINLIQSSALVVVSALGVMAAVFHW